jgi:hypothetical protein
MTQSVTDPVPGTELERRVVVVDDPRITALARIVGARDSAGASVRPAVLAREPFVEQVRLPASWGGAMTASTRWRMHAPVARGATVTLSTTVSARWYRKGRENVTYTTTMTDADGTALCTADVTLFTTIDEALVPAAVERRP